MLKINQYISELNIKELKIDDYLTLMTSPTGSGKTEFMFSQKGLSIVAFPYTSQVRANSTKRLGYQFLEGNKNYTPDGESNIVCTYDKLVNLLDDDDIDLSEYTLFLDECHSLYTQSDYRSRVMHRIVQGIQERRFKNVVMFSATFEKKFLPNLKIDNHIKIQLNKKRSEPLTAVYLQDSKITMNEAMVQFFDESNPSGRVFIYRNDKTANQALANMLEKRGYSVLIGDADKKDNDNIQQFLAEERMGLTQVLISTSLLTEGLNILFVRQNYFNSLCKSFSKFSRKKKSFYLICIRNK